VFSQLRQPDTCCPPIMLFIENLTCIGPLERASSAAASEQELLLHCLRQAGNLPSSTLDGLTRGAPSWNHLTRNPEVGLPQIDPNLLASHFNGHVPDALQPQDAIAMLLQNNLKQAAMLAGLNGNMHGAPLSTNVQRTDLLSTWVANTAFFKSTWKHWSCRITGECCALHGTEHSCPNSGSGQ
jgi:hypothetical protein